MAERDLGHNPIQLRTTSWWIVYNIVCKFSSQRSKTDQSLAQTVHTPIKKPQNNCFAEGPQRC